MKGAEMPLDASFTDFEYSLLFVFLYPVSIHDIKYRRIPPMLMGVAVVLFIFLGVTRDKAPDYMIYARIVIGYAYIYALFIISKGKIGMGDAKVSALIALALGFKLWIWTFIFASMFGIMYGSVFVKLELLEMDSKIPYVPFLTLGCYLVLLLKNFCIL
jgi:leader peptidase (prepilin peptidase) / N-methyltransferase